MASRGVHCLLPGRKVAACADGPDVQNSSGWPCQCVLRSWPLHLLWPHSGWYIVTVCPSVVSARMGCLCRLLRARAALRARLFLRSPLPSRSTVATPEALITSSRIVLAACVLHQQSPMAP